MTWHRRLKNIEYLRTCSNIVGLAVAQPKREFLSVSHVGGGIGVLEYLGIALEEAVVILGGLVGYGGGGHGGLGERGVTVCSTLPCS